MVTIRRIFRPRTANTRPHSDYSAGNYHLIDEESTAGMVIPPGITSS
jgi:hypothetical protein